MQQETGLLLIAREEPKSASKHMLELGSTWSFRHAIRSHCNPGQQLDCKLMGDLESEHSG